MGKVIYVNFGNNADLVSQEEDSFFGWTTKEYLKFLEGVKNEYWYFEDDELKVK